LIATGGFGALPENSLTTALQKVIVENFPPDLVNSFNLYMDQVSAPRISPSPVSESDAGSAPDPAGTLLSFFEGSGVTPTNGPSLIQQTLVVVGRTQTQVAFLQSVSATSTQALTQTQTSIPSVTLTVPPRTTQTAIPTLTLPSIFYRPPTATFAPEPASTSTFTATPTDTPLPTFTPTNTFTPVPGNLVFYFGGTTAGNIGPRSSADALCAANLPAGFGNYHSFIGYSTADSIANMPSNYGISTSLPIQSVTSAVIAANWADLMDGSISISLSAAGVTPSQNWWSGAENADGSHLDGVTADCNEWTSNSNVVGGNEGNRSSVTASWMDVGFGVACDQPIAVLCIAY